MTDGRWRKTCKVLLVLGDEKHLKDMVGSAENSKVVLCKGECNATTTVRAIA